MTATGAIFGFIAQNSNSLEIYYLIPLVILLPTWCIFFDKATTITRILGYYLILDDISYCNGEYEKLLPYETAISNARGKIAESIRAGTYTGTKLTFWKDMGFWKKLEFLYQEILIRHDPPSYWSLVFTTFLGISALCILLSATSIIVSLVHWTYPTISLVHTFILGSVVLTVFVTRYNLIILHELREGAYSVIAIKSYWEKEFK